MPTFHLWTRVEYALPDSDLTVMIGNARWSDPVWLGYHDGEDWYSVDGALLADDDDCESEDLLPPTHWMHLPEPPPHSVQEKEPAKITPALLLPAPRLHRCTRCQVSTVALACPSRQVERGRFFIEHETALEGERYTFDLCDRCEVLFQEEQSGWEDFSITLGRGTPAWGAWMDAFAGLEYTPLICITDEQEAGWKECLSQPGETWLFCRNPREWRAAWQLARILVNSVNDPEKYPHLLLLLPAYKLPGAHTLTVHLDRWQPGTFSNQQELLAAGASIQQLLELIDQNLEGLFYEA